MAQSIVLQVGQSGNQIGMRFWDMVLHEHAKHNSSGVYDEALATFFRNVDSKNRTLLVQDGRSNIKHLKARAVLVDMEEGVLNSIQHSYLNELFSPTSFISSTDGSGNNWAVGHKHYGPLYHETLLESIRHEAEHCDSLASFFIMHSVGGGTGSGLGTYLTQQLADEYPEAIRFSNVVIPSKDDDVVTSPYNSVLALSKLTDYADCVLPIENAALIDIVNRIEAVRAADMSSSGAASKLSITQLRKPGTALIDDPEELVFARGGVRKMKKNAKKDDDDDENENENEEEDEKKKCRGKTGGLVMASTSVTPTVVPQSKKKAFDTMNNIVAHLLMNMTSSMRFEGALNVDINEIATNLVPFPRLKYLLSSCTPWYGLADMNVSHRRLDQMFQDAFSPSTQFLQADPKRALYLACGLIVRGQVTVSDIRRNIDKIRPGLKFTKWNREGWKTGLCSVGPLGQPYSLLTLSNNTCLKETFGNMRGRFVKLFKRRANLHHYTKYMEYEDVKGALMSMDDLIAEYGEIERMEM